MRYTHARITSFAAGWLLMLAWPVQAAQWVFEGHLVPPEGRSVADYTVCLEYQEGRRQRPPADFLIEQAPGADGTFRIAVEPYRSQYWLFVRDREGRVAIGYPHLNASRDFDAIALRDDGELMGVLHTPDGEPAGDVHVQLERKLEARCSHYVEAGTVRSDAQGGFAFDRLHPGDYRLRVESERYTHAATDVTVTEDINYLELQLVPAASIGGRVTLSDGSPVAGMSVQADRRPSAVVTDAEGRYRLGGLGPETYRLRVWGESLAMENFDTLAVTLGREDVTAPDIVVVPVGALRVTLEREAPGEPLPERLAIALEARGERRHTFPFHAPLEDGVALFENLAPGNFGLRLQSEELGDVRTDVAIASGEITVLTLTLPEVFTLRGRVVDGAGEPLEGARAMYRSTPASTAMTGGRDSFANMISRHARSDAEGRFSLKGLPAGEGMLTVQSENRVPFNETLTLPAASDAERVFTLDEGLSVVVRIVDDAGDPVPGVTLRLSPEQPDQERQRLSYHASDTRGESDADGTVTLRALTPGRYRVSVDAPEHFGDFEPIEITAETERLDDLVLQRGLEITGSVTEADGRPITGARVHAHAMPTTAARGMQLSRQSETDAEGAFRIGGLPEGTYRVSIRDAGTYEELATLSDVPAGEDELMVILAPNYTIPLHVFAPDGSPAAGAAIAVASAGRHHRIRHAHDADNKTDGEGRTTIEVRGGSRYTLEARLAPWVEASSTLDLSEGRDAPEVVEIRMQAGVTIGGTVVDAGGEPRPGVYVTVADREAIQADAQGAFEMPGVGAGVLVLRVHADPERKTPLAVHRMLIEDTAASVPPVKIALPEPGAVRGTLRDAEGAPVSDAMVMLNAMSDGFSGHMGALQAQTAADGGFAFDSVMPGSYMIMAVQTGGRHGMMSSGMSSMRMIEVAAGETVVANLPETVEAAETVTGRITRDGEPLAEGRVMFIPLGEDGRMNMLAGMSMMNREPPVTDADGRYTAENLTPGQYLVIVAEGKDGHPFASDGAQLTASVTIEAGQSELDIAIDGIALRGIVEGTDGEPAAGAQVTVAPGSVDIMMQGMMSQAVETGEDGRFEISNLAAGRYRVTVVDDGREEAVSVTLDLDADETAEQTIRLAPGQRIAGHVSREPDGPIGHAFVMAFSADGNPLGGAGIDEDGSFTMDSVLPRGRYFVACLHQEFVAPGQFVEAGADAPLAFVLRPGGDIAVALTGDPDQVANRMLEISDGDGNRVERMTSTFDMGYMASMTRSLSLLPTDADGRTQVYGLPAGTYIVRLADSDVQATVTVRPFEQAAVELALE